MAATNITSNPFPVGILQPGATYASASIGLLSNLTFPVGSNLNFIHSYSVRAAAGNTGSIYLCNSSATPDTTAYSNVLDQVPAGGTSYAATGALNGIDASKLFIGASNSGDFAIVEILWS